MSALLEVRRDPGLISAPEKKEGKKMEGQGKGSRQSFVLFYHLSGGCSFEQAIALLTADNLVREADFSSIL